jgi:hypothetical protein
MVSRGIFADQASDDRAQCPFGGLLLEQCHSSTFAATAAGLHGLLSVLLEAYTTPILTQALHRLCSP